LPRTRNGPSGWVKELRKKRAVMGGAVFWGSRKKKKGGGKPAIRLSLNAHPAWIIRETRKSNQGDHHEKIDRQKSDSKKEVGF